MADIDAATEQELLGAAEEEYLDSANDEILHEDELLGEEKKENGQSSPLSLPKKAEDSVKEEIDLYDEAVAPSINTSIIEEKPLALRHQVVASTSSTSTSSTTSGGKYYCYVGNLTWWTTDADLAVNIAALGVTDVIETKFFENRINGQSKGFALCVFGSDSSLKNVTENLVKRQIHGSTVCVLPYTKQSLSRLEEACAKTQTRPDNKTKKEDGCVNMGTIRIGAGPPSIRSAVPPMATTTTMNRPPGPLPLMINGQPQMQAPPLMNRPIAPPGVGIGGMGQVQMGPVVSMAPGAPRPLLGAPMGGVMPPQPLMNSMQMRPPGMSYGAPQPLMQTRMGMPPPGAHVNPQVFPGMQQMGGAIADAEFEEIMNRNRTVSSSAISRAVADAAAGDPKAAIETLMTAITLIKQSRVAHDDRCRLLIAGLQDTLTGIESKMGSYGSSSRGSRYRDRDRSRSRERDRKRRRRSRSSSGSRSRSRSPRHRSSRHY